MNGGEAVGVIAAQSIGEPGTQLTMRTFHIGGTAQVVDQSFIESNFDGVIKMRNRNIGRDSEGKLIAMGRNMAVVVEDGEGNERSVNRVTYGSRLHVDDGDEISRGQRIAEWDPYTRPILTEVNGKVTFEDLVDGASVSESTDEATGITKRVVIDWRTSTRTQDLKPAVVITDAKGKPKKLSRGSEARSLLSVDAILSVEPGAMSNRAMFWRASHWKVPRLATSPAVCRGLPNCSRRVDPKTMPSSPRSTARLSSGATTRISAGS